MSDGQPMASGKPRPYWRPLRPGETVYVLSDPAGEAEESRGRPAGQIGPAEEMLSETAARFMREQAPHIFEQIVSEAAHRMIRELAPGIIERIIREEIEKLKSQSGETP